MEVKLDPTSIDKPDLGYPELYYIIQVWPEATLNYVISCKDNYYPSAKYT